MGREFQKKPVRTEATCADGFCLISDVAKWCDFMTNSQKKQLEQKLWNIANELRGKMNADEFRDYCLV